MSNQAYPLSWPVTVKRTPLFRTRRARFGKFEKAHSVSQCVAEILRQLKLLGAADIVISSNLALRMDGLPRSGQAGPQDVGVAVYFKLRESGQSTDYVLPCDCWNKVEDNMWAIAKHVDAQRGQLRWGVGSVKAAFAGYAQLPGQGETAGEAWWTVLEVAPDANVEAIKSAYRIMAFEAHPDRGGSDAAMARLNAARDTALKEKGQ